MTDAIDEVIAREGGYVHRATDHGGPTKYGITRMTLAAWRGVPVTAHDVETLTIQEARSIYLAIYASELERIEHHPDLYRFVLDLAVHSGTRTAIRLLQSTVNTVTEAGLVVDGRLGPLTAAAIEAAPSAKLVQALVAARIPALIRIVERDVSQLEYLEGWVTRALSFLPEPV